MEKTKFWSRVGHWFNPTSEAIGDGGGLSSAGSAGEATERTLQTQGRAVPGTSSAVTQRQSDKDRMEEAYTTIIDLVGSIRSHLELQDRRAERMAPTLERLAEGLADIPEASKAQVDLLTHIGRRLEDDAETAKRIEASLAQLPHIADAQRETMVSMGRQLDTLGEANERGAASFGEFGKTLSELTNATRESTSSLKHIEMDAAAREEDLTRIIKQQTKRLTACACAAIALATIAATVSVLALLR